MIWLAASDLFRWQDAVDFVALAVALYLQIGWTSEARVLRVTLGVVLLHAAAQVGLLRTMRWWKLPFRLPVLIWAP